MRPATNELGVDGPVLDRLEGGDLSLALDGHPQRGRLHAPGREPSSHLLPQQGADLVADQTVQDAAGLLGVHALRVDGAWIGHRRQHGVLGDLVELDPTHGAITGIDRLDQVPRDRLALPVGVRRHKDLVGALSLAPQLLHRFRLLAWNQVLGLKVPVQVHAQLALGQISNVPERSEHVIIAPKVLSDGFRFRGRFHDNELITHERMPLT